MSADIVLVSSSIFPARAGDKAAFPGFVAITGNTISAVGGPGEKDAWVGPNTKVYDLGDKTVCPGFLDNHVFFTGYVWQRYGADLSGAKTAEEAAELLRRHAEGLPAGKAAVGHDLDGDLCGATADALWTALGDRPAVGFSEGRDGCIMNKAAKEAFGFDEDGVYAEACHKVFRQYLTDVDYITAQYAEFSQLLASRGVTAIKEIGFDQYSDFWQVLQKLDADKKLAHRVNLVSQPVGAGMDYDYATTMREKFKSDFVQFIGFNVMVDGEIATHEADMLEPYADKDTRCDMDVDYAGLEAAVLKADKLGLRCALHAEGDAGVRRTVDIFEKCRQVNGARDSRHVITDLECVNPADLKRIAELGITTTNYVQILDCYADYAEFMEFFEAIGEGRLGSHLPYRQAVDAGVHFCCGTDLPLTVPHIPLSVYFTTKRRFLDGNPPEGFNTQNTITVAETLRAWTAEGQYANFKEDVLGTLEAGKLADIAVLDGDIFAAGADALPNMGVALTLCDGKVVYEG